MNGPPLAQESCLPRHMCLAPTGWHPCTPASPLSAPAPTSGGGEPLGGSESGRGLACLPAGRIGDPSLPSPRMKGVAHKNTPTGMGLRWLSSDRGRRAVGPVWPWSPGRLLRVCPGTWAEPDVGVPAHRPTGWHLRLPPWLRPLHAQPDAAVKACGCQAGLPGVQGLAWEAPPGELPSPVAVARAG